MLIVRGILGRAPAPPAFAVHWKSVHQLKSKCRVVGCISAQHRGKNSSLLWGGSRAWWHLSATYLDMLGYCILNVLIGNVSSVN